MKILFTYNCKMQYLLWSSLGLFFGFAFVIFLLTKYIITARKVTFFIFNKTLLSSLSGSLFFFLILLNLISFLFTWRYAFNWTIVLAVLIADFLTVWTFLISAATFFRTSKLCWSIGYRSGVKNLCLFILKTFIHIYVYKHDFVLCCI